VVLAVLETPPPMPLLVIAVPPCASLATNTYCLNCNRTAFRLSCVLNGSPCKVRFSRAMGGRAELLVTLQCPKLVW